jgi:hypothetical protein
MQWVAPTLTQIRVDPQSLIAALPCRQRPHDRTCRR